MIGSFIHFVLVLMFETMMLTIGDAPLAFHVGAFAYIIVAGYLSVGMMLAYGTDAWEA